MQLIISEELSTMISYISESEGMKILYIVKDRDSLFTSQEEVMKHGYEWKEVLQNYSGGIWSKKDSEFCFIMCEELNKTRIHIDYEFNELWADSEALLGYRAWKYLDEYDKQMYYCKRK